MAIWQALQSHQDALLQTTLDTNLDSPDNDTQQLNNNDSPSPHHLNVTANHPIYIENQGWLNAENLSIGDRLRRADGGMARVLAIERVALDEAQLVYNFTVKGPHTYFVLEVGVLVHNCGPQWDKNVQRWRDPETGRFVKSPDSVEMLTDPETGLVLPKEYVEAIETLGMGRRELFDSYHKNYKEGVDFETFINNYVANNPHGVNRLDAHSIFGYTTKHFYNRLNSLLREGKNADQTADIEKLINNALQKMPTISGNHFRGIGLSDEVLEKFLKQHSSGDPVTYRDFISAANNKQRWWEDYNVRIRIEPKNARDISDLAFGVNFQDKVGLGPNYPQESLIMSESIFKVDDIRSEVEDGRTVYNIWLTQIK